MHSLALLSYLIATVTAFPFVSEIPGLDTTLLEDVPKEGLDKRQATCPFNSNHQGAAPYNSQFPYTGARNGLPGNGRGGVQVPAPGDTAHAFEAPGPNDIRGVCPGLNALANHHVSYIYLSARMPQHSS